MVSWNIALGLMVIALVLPFVYLRSELVSLRRRVRQTQTEREHLRYMLRDLEQHVQNDKSLFLEALGVPFLLVRPSGRLVMANRLAGKLLGVDEHRHINLLRVLPEGELREVISAVLYHREPQVMHTSVQASDGVRYLRVDSMPLCNAEGHVGIVFHDVTEEHRTHIIRRDFVANASHELRTPLTILRGYLETLLEEPADEELLVRSLGIMKNHTDRITRLVEDMLTVSRLENADKSYLKMSAFDFSAVVDEVLLRLEVMVREQQVCLQKFIEPCPFMMYGDEFYWSQILFNLLENAMKNNLAPGLRIRIGACVGAAGEVVITVQDDGVGISPEALPYIFNRFYRADGSGKVKGTGLGLSIVKHAVELHGGSVTVESKPGDATLFRIKLPAVSHVA